MKKKTNRLDERFAKLRKDVENKTGIPVKSIEEEYNVLFSCTAIIVSKKTGKLLHHDSTVYKIEKVGEQTNITSGGDFVAITQSLETMKMIIAGLSKHFTKEKLLETIENRVKEADVTKPPPIGIYR